MTNTLKNTTLRMFLHFLGLPWRLSSKDSTCQCRRCGFDSWVGKISWRREWQPTPVFLPEESHGQRSLAGYSPWGCKELDINSFLFFCFPSSSAGKESACNAVDLGSILELGRSPGERKGYPLQYSGLENPMDYSPWGHKELDTTEWLSLLLHFPHANHEPLEGRVSVSSTIEAP